MDRRAMLGACAAFAGLGGTAAVVTQELKVAINALDPNEVRRTLEAAKLSIGERVRVTADIVGLPRTGRISGLEERFMAPGPVEVRCRVDLDDGPRLHLLLKDVVLA